MVAGQFLESVLVVSAIAYAAVLAASLAYKDGRIWTVWRWNVGLGFAGTLLGVFLVHWIDRRIHLSWGISILSALISIARLGQAVTNVILAFHLHRIINPRKTGGPI